MTTESIERLSDEIPTKLRWLADWLDIKFPNDLDPEVQRDLRSWADALQSLLPKPGMVMVPREPTDEMCAAAGRALDGQNLTKMGRKARARYKAAVRYRAMLSAHGEKE